MSLKKAIEHGKERRKQYRGSKAVSCSCRNHGPCSYCKKNRTIFDTRARMRLSGQENEYFGYWGMSDPSDADEAHSEKLYRRFGIDPDDWDLLVELGELHKG